MTEADSNIEDLSNPYAKTLLLSSLIVVATTLVAYYTQYLQVLRIPLAYLLPLCLLGFVVLGVLLYRQGKDSIPVLPLIGGIILMIGGAALDIIATILSTPTLAQEANPIVRALLGSGHNVKFVYGYGLIAQILFTLLVCVLWAAFLRHRLTLISSALNAQPKSGFEFIKAATGGGHLSWRQYLLPLKPSELPKSYHMIWLVAAIMPGGMLYRWYLGLNWLGVVGNSNAVAIITLILVSLLTYVAWLWFQYSSKSKAAA